MDPKRCFHPGINTAEAMKLLQSKGQDGSFLCFHSVSSGYFSIAVRKGNEVVTMRINSEHDQYFLHNGTAFDTIWNLLIYYVENPGLLKLTNGESVHLKQPLYVQSSIKERWFHGSISGQEAEKLLMGRGSSGSYLLRSSVSSPGDMVLQIRKDNHVTNVKIYNKGTVYDVGGGLQFTCLSNLIDHYKRNPMAEMNGEVIQLNEPLFATTLLPCNIKQRIDDLSTVVDKGSKNGFAEEFDHLHSYQCKVLHSRKEGTKPANQSKNRYPNIIPFDYNRVILDTANQISSDYINASYISGLVVDSEKKYIATQGCLECTINDFWSMVYVEDVSIIVMTTNENEQDNDKCACYWPKIAHSKTYGRIRVQAMSVDKGRHYILREFYLSNENGTGKYVSQYHFTSWPSKGIPENPDSVLTLLQEIRQHYKFLKESSKVDIGPIVIHCNNGIGRTGSLIAVDIIIDFLKTKGLEQEIDIMGTVLHIRNQRFGMVQTEEQYRFIYLAIMAYIKNKQNELISLD